MKLSPSWIRRKQSSAGISKPTIFITAHDDPATRKRARSGVAYLRKPFREHAAPSTRRSSDVVPRSLILSPRSYGSAFASSLVLAASCGRMLEVDERQRSESQGDRRREPHLELS
jgi:hypothetical protein